MTPGCWADLTAAAPLAGLRALQNEQDCRGLRERLATNGRTRVLLIATEGTTGANGERYRVGSPVGRSAHPE